ncbi:MAG: bacteriophage abortive infection AbiH family protein [Candidatus Pacebacteria bacterium]|nr:bacteriophage abortive infection AbiH family protein [Candidatus Paceibacterota bacterium]
MHTKLYIIGNGFDLYHGLPTKYSEFADYILQISPETLNICKYTLETNEYWCDLEKSLGELIPEDLIQDLEVHAPSYGAEDWSDSGHHDFQFEVDKILNSIVKELPVLLRNWIVGIENNFKYYYNSKRLRCIDINGLYLNFNYTCSLTKIYNISRNQVMYVHGESLNINSTLIYGHGYHHENDIKQLNRDYGCVNGEGDPRYEEVIHMIDSYFVNTKKPVEKIISENIIFFNNLNNISEIFVIGHSLSVVDLPYFVEVIRKTATNNVKWFVSYKFEQEKVSFWSKLIELGVSADSINFCNCDNLLTC